MNSKIIVFDCGGVVGGDMAYTFVKNHIATNYPDKVESANQLLTKNLWARIRVDPDYSDKQYFIDFVNLLNIPSDDQLIEQFMNHTKQELHAFIPPLQVALSLQKSGVSTYILSNHGKDWFNYIYDSDPLFKEAFPHKEKLVVSYQVACYKPQQEIFQKCWDIIRDYEAESNNRQFMDKTRVMFFDDKLANINAAQTFGWGATQFNFNTDAIEDLEIAIKEFLASPDTPSSQT